MTSRFLLPRHPGVRVTAFAALLAIGAGCSLINAPDDVNPGTGGAGGEGGAGGSGAGGTGGMPPASTVPEDCASLTTDCARGNCVEGSCVAEPMPADTPCGAAPTSTCDLADVCDGAGTCVNATVPDGTNCDDCPAGPGQCATCSAGACNDCPGRATEKSFRAPLAASGWELTGSWAVYEEAPVSNIPFGGQVPMCSDGFDNDGDMLVDYPDDPDCASPGDVGEFPNAACGDGADNDGDTLIDFPNDPDCDSAVDDTEQGPTRFARPVLGTDGNRRHPYSLGVSELEESTATSPFTRIPTELHFRSWHFDEGSAYDLKAVQLTLDGASYQTIAVCPQGMASPYPFCQPSNPGTPRPADLWDDIVLPVPAEFQNQIGRVRFLYDTTDSCCNFEKGWYVDALNFAQDCACDAADDCGYVAGACGMGQCDAVTAECAPAAVNFGSDCELPTSPECSAPTCGSNGLCSSNFMDFEGEPCTSCPDGPGLCQLCSNGLCPSCDPEQTFSGFFTTAGWQFTGDWSTFQGGTPPNSLATTTFLSFNTTMPFDPLAPHQPPMLGNDGSRTGANPWTSAAREIEIGTARSAPSVLPATLTFRSWHQDRGGKDAFNLRDKKTIRGSLDGGMTWTLVVNCEGNNAQPFCQPWDPMANRDADDWDDVTIAMPANLAGQVGILEFSYDTVDQGVGWERGWYIDDINIDRCN